MIHRALFTECLPFLAAIAGSVLILRILIVLSDARPRWSHLRTLNRDESGAVQSLSFVLTLPLFVMIMLFIVQLSQLTIGRVFVEYAAFAAARSAAVWIPARTPFEEESENRISHRLMLGEVVDDWGTRFTRFEVVDDRESPKLHRINLAAAMALMPICPSRNVVAQQNVSSSATVSAVDKAYHAIAPSARQNTRVSARLRNKLAYALESTEVRIEVWHKESEPPLERAELPGYVEEFEENEVGWQDQLIVTVDHEFALLPGPGRFLARNDNSVRRRIRTRNDAFTYAMRATTRLNNEGEKSVRPYVHPSFLEPTITGDP